MSEIEACLFIGICTGLLLIALGLFIWWLDVRRPPGASDDWRENPTESDVIYEVRRRLVKVGVANTKDLCNKIRCNATTLFLEGLLLRQERYGTFKRVYEHPWNGDGWKISSGIPPRFDSVNQNH